MPSQMSASFRAPQPSPPLPAYPVSDQEPLLRAQQSCDIDRCPRSSSLSPRSPLHSQSRPSDVPRKLGYYHYRPALDTASRNLITSPERSEPISALQSPVRESFAGEATEWKRRSTDTTSRARQSRRARS